MASLPPPLCARRYGTLFYTGLYPVRRGAYPNHTRVDPQTPSVFHHLSELGYRVGLLGKTHISPAVSFPFENLSSQAKDFDKAAVTDTAFSLC